MPVTIARAHVSRILLAVTLSVTTAEFMEIQALPVESLRTRFALPPSCQPLMTALSADPSAGRMTVAIECRSEPGAEPAGPRPSGERARPSSSSRKGS
jgi:hypothetical protein